MHKNDIRIGTLVQGSKKMADYIRQILPHGFETFSIVFADHLGGGTLKTLAGQIDEVLAGSDAAVSSVGVYGNPLLKNAAGQATRDALKKCIDSAHLFGCDIVTGFTGRIVNEPIDASMKRFKQVWAPLVKRAGDKGIRIAFENCDMGGDWNRGDWNIALNPTAWEMMFDAITADNVGLEWEPCHQMVSLIDPMPQLRKWVKKIFHVHGKDATVLWDVVRTCGVHGPEPFVFHRTPGFGDSNWTDIVSQLRLGGFVGSIDIEGWHDPVYRDELEMTGQVRALEYLKRCRGGSPVPNPT